MNSHDKKFSDLIKQFDTTGQTETVPANLISRCASDIEIRPISWLWKHRFAKGKLSLIAGEPGLGKSQATISMAAHVSSGKPWPDGALCDQGNVLFISAEDDPADTIIPRLKAANAVLERIHIVDAVKATGKNGKEILNQFSLITDLIALEEKINEIGNVSVIFIDPLACYLGDKTDEHKNASVRSILTPLSKFAERFNIAIIGVTHLNKSEQQKPLNRIIGSIGFIAAARAAFIVLRDKDNDKQRYLVPLKNNIGNDSTGLSFYIEEFDLGNEIKTSRINWSNEIINMKADELMGMNTGEDKTSRQDAKDFLCDILGKGPIPVTEIYNLAEQEGIATRTIRRAKDDLNIHIIREGFGKGGKSLWSLNISAVS